MTLQGDTSLTAGSGITFGKTVDGSFDLRLAATAGSVTFQGIVGGAAALDTLAVDRGRTRFEGLADTVKTTGNQSYAGDVSLGVATMAFNLGPAGDVNFARQLTGVAADVTITGRNATFGGDVSVKSLATNGGGVTFLGTDTPLTITTVDAQSYVDDLQVKAPATLVAGGTITFQKTVKGPSSLTARTPAETRFVAPVGGAADADRLASLTVDGGGAAALEGGSVHTAGAQAYTGPLLLRRHRAGRPNPHLRHHHRRSRGHRQGPDAAVPRRRDGGRGTHQRHQGPEGRARRHHLVAQ